MEFGLLDELCKESREEDLRGEGRVCQIGHELRIGVHDAHVLAVRHGSSGVARNAL